MRGSNERHVGKGADARDSRIATRRRRARGADVVSARHGATRRKRVFLMRSSRLYAGRRAGADEGRAIEGIEGIEGASIGAP